MESTKKGIKRKMDESVPTINQAKIMATSPPQLRKKQKIQPEFDYFSKDSKGVPISKFKPRANAAICARGWRDFKLQDECCPEESEQ